ncbi:uncharacterized protein LOC112467807 isoform X1 [Temnothorax curvispinosus]|uniref:Uncharacterized protein LOC112467807 isoform X1 n=1 Tax=Temnothorax curvispinosus TaxID=300111 RepID=A0A6J1RI80_9HYME|nr:uncharacterized protein LOC112467807 isoform X1 [Temnothorax curvispinosus]XP_024892396.1 uncharacterized protein LOC112467807 isoform X1 [Temnothorax curvispinosus]
MTEGSNNDSKDAREPSRCFVCDDEVLGRSYALATCRTQNSRTRVIEKLGELVGEGYMVVISEDDVICRSCGVFVNTLDRLETEMRNTRDHILRFLEQKYSLQDGELCGDKPKPCQPPQIRRSGDKEISVRCDEPRNESPGGSKRIPKRSHSWLQCDKCKYTTHLNSFVMHHSRDRIKQRLFCDDCGQYTMENQQDKRHICNKAGDLGNKENEADNSGVTSKNDEVEMTLLKQAQPILPVTQVTSSLMGLSNCDHLYLPNTLPASDSMSSRQPVYVLQSINVADIDNSRKRTRSDSNLDQTEAKDRGEGRKQVLTLKEDGSLQMVEIMPRKETKAPNIDSTIAFK